MCINPTNKSVNFIFLQKLCKETQCFLEKFKQLVQKICTTVSRDVRDTNLKSELHLRRPGEHRAERKTDNFHLLSLGCGQAPEQSKKQTVLHIYLGQQWFWARAKTSNSFFNIIIIILRFGVITVVFLPYTDIYVLMCCHKYILRDVIAAT